MNKNRSIAPLVGVGILAFHLSQNAWGFDPVEQLLNFLARFKTPPGTVQGLLSDRGVHLEELRTLLVPFGFQGNAPALEARLRRLDRAPEGVFHTAQMTRNNGAFSVRSIPPSVEYLLDPNLSVHDVNADTVLLSYERNGQLVGLEAIPYSPGREVRVSILPLTESELADSFLDACLERQSPSHRILIKGEIPRNHPAILFGKEKQSGIEIARLSEEYGLPSRQTMRDMSKSPALLQKLFSSALASPDGKERLAFWYSENGMPIPRERLSGLGLTFISDVVANLFEQTFSGSQSARHALDKLSINAGPEVVKWGMIRCAMDAKNADVGSAAESHFGGRIATLLIALEHPNEGIALRAATELASRSQIPIPSDKRGALLALRTSVASHGSDAQKLASLDALMGRLVGCGPRDVAGKFVERSQPKTQ